MITWTPPPVLQTKTRRFPTHNWCVLTDIVSRRLEYFSPIYCCKFPVTIENGKQTGNVLCELSNTDIASLVSFVHVTWWFSNDGLTIDTLKKWSVIYYCLEVWRFIPEGSHSPLFWRVCVIHSHLVWKSPIQKRKDCDIFRNNVYEKRARHWKFADCNTNLGNYINTNFGIKLKMQKAKLIYCRNFPLFFVTNFRSDSWISSLFLRSLIYSPPPGAFSQKLP